MGLKLKLNEFFRNYKLFTTSQKLLEMVSCEEFKNKYLSKYPNLTKVIDEDKLSETLATLIYSYKGSYESFGILARALGSIVAIYDTENNLIYNSLDYDGSLQTNVGLIRFTDLDYSASSEITGALKDLAKELLWYITQDTEIKVGNVHIDLVGNSVYLNEYDVDYVNFITME